MSDIRAGTISDAAGTGPITLTGQSASKAWVTFKGTATQAIEGSQYVSSLVDNGTGDYTINFTSSFSSINYAYAGMGGKNTTSQVCVTQPRNLSAPTVSSIRHQTLIADTSLADARVASITYHGDLA